MTAKASYYVGSQTMEVREAPAALPGPGEVKLKMAYGGICGTDLHIFHGKMDARVKPPQIVGHEMSGVVAEVGEGVEDWEPGDAVVVRPLDWCGACPACKAGHSHICMNLKFMGIDSVGGFQDYWIVKARTLYRVPEGLSFERAALIEPVAVACHVMQVADIKPGDFSVVLGGGPIGLLVAMVARAEGADVRLCEVNPFRIDVARAAGFEVLHPTEQDVGAAVNEATGGAGADLVFEVSGSAAAVASMTDLLRTRGKIVNVALHTERRPIDLFRFFWRELRLCGARLYTGADFEKALALAASGTLALDGLITGVYPLDRIQEAFESLEDNAQSMKTLVRCSDLS